MRVDRVMATAAAVGATAWLTAHATAPAVRGWSAPNRRDVGDGPLHATATALGDGPVVVALHGITASGRSFGAAFDDLPFVALDVLGFGGSMDVDTEGYTREHHLDALTTTLRGIGVLGRPLVLVGHSMGAVLALHAASRLPGVMGVIAISAPLYDDEEEGLDRIARTDRLASLLATGNLAERVCTWMCNHRTTAGILWPLLAPEWPWPIAADGVLHTWPAYRGSLQSLVLDSGWRDAMDRLAESGVPVLLINGADDPVQVPARAMGLATHPTVELVEVEGAGHELPLSHGAECARAIEARLDRWARTDRT